MCPNTFKQKLVPWVRAENTGELLRVAMKQSNIEEMENERDL